MPRQLNKVLMLFFLRHNVNVCYNFSPSLFYSLHFRTIIYIEFQVLSNFPFKSCFLNLLSFFLKMYSWALSLQPQCYLGMLWKHGQTASRMWPGYGWQWVPNWELCRLKTKEQWLTLVIHIDIGTFYPELRTLSSWSTFPHWSKQAAPTLSPVFSLYLSRGTAEPLIMGWEEKESLMNSILSYQCINKRGERTIIFFRFHIR